MSFKIEFTGSLVDNRDLPQITASSSLVKSTLSPISPLLGDSNLVEFNTTGPYSGDPQWSQSSTTENIYLSTGGTYTGNTNFLGIPISGIFVHNGQNPELNFYYYRPAFANQTLTYQIRFYLSTTPSFSSASFYTVDGSNNVVQPNLITNVSNGQDYNGTITVGPTGKFGIYIAAPFEGGASLALGFYHVRIFTGGSTPVSISTVTTLEGAQKTGGTLATPTITEEVIGRPDTSAPTEYFGLVAKDGVTPIASAKYLPPAQDAQDAYLDTTDEAYFTAQTDTVTVESEGTSAATYIETDSVLLIEDEEARREK